MKKSLLWVVVLLLSISMVAAFSLYGCKPKAEEEVAEEEVAEEEVAEEEVAEEEVAEEEAPLPSGHLVIWLWEQNDQGLDAALEGFNELYPDISWEYTLMGGADVYVNFPLAITAGEGAPDICLIENSHLQQMIGMGGLVDVTADIQPFLNDLAPYKLKECRVGDKYYAVPWDSSPVGMYYRRDVFENAGLPSDPETVADLVSTYDKYYEVAKTIKAETGQFMMPLSKANNNGRMFEKFLYQQSLGYVDADGKVAINSPGAVATLEFMGKMVSEGLYSDEAEWTEEFYNRLSSIDNSADASLIFANWMDPNFKQWLCPNTSGLWGLVPMPAWEEGGVRASADGGSALVISEQSQNPDAARALIKYALLTDKGVINTFLSIGYTPTLMTSYSSDVFKIKDPFYGGEVIGSLFNEINSNIPEAYVYSEDYAEMNTITLSEIAKYLTGGQTAQEALDNAAAAIRAATGRQ